MSVRAVPAEATAKAPGFAEFVALVALTMGITALSIDNLLPAFSPIGIELGVSDPNRLQMLIQGPDIDQLQNYVVELQAKIRTIPGIVDVGSNFELTQQELRVIVDRVRAADLGVQIDTLANNLRTLIGGQVLNTQFKQGDQQYEVQLRLDEAFRNDPSRLGSLLIPSSTQRVVKLSDVAQLKLDRGGGVCVFCGSAEIGQGSDSILAYIVAEVLGIDPSTLYRKLSRYGLEA